MPWLDDQAEDAANLHVSIFGNSRSTRIVRYGEAGPGPSGRGMVVSLDLDDRPFSALNGG